MGNYEDETSPDLASWRKGPVNTPFSGNQLLPTGPGEGTGCPLTTADGVRPRYRTQDELRDVLP